MKYTKSDTFILFLWYNFHTTVTASFMNDMSADDP